MDWRLVVCGINHKTSPIDRLGPLQIGHDRAAGAHVALSELDGIMEAVAVSTCNRVEFYLVARKALDPFVAVASFYRNFAGADIAAWRDNFYTKENIEAARHLLRVGAGIESMVLGEDQILGQIKAAYSSACAAKTAGKVIHRLFHQAFRTGKDVRTDTEMSKGNCSVSSAAVEMLKAKMPPQPTVLFVGVSPMISLAAAALSKFDCKFLFANRTEEKTAELAKKYRAQGFSLAHLPSLLARADVTVTCTASPEPIITRPMIAELLELAPHKRLVFMDMSVTRDVEFRDEFAPGIEVYALDHIKKFVAEQRQRREAAIPQAEEIIERKLGEFVYWFEHVRHDPLYNGVAGTFEEIRRQEMAEVLKKLPPELREEVESATLRLVRRLLPKKIQSDAQTF